MAEFQQKGIVFQTNRYGDLIMCIHSQTAISFIQTLITNPDGWSRHKIRKYSRPRKNITHGMEQIDMFRELKVDGPEEYKAAG